MGKLKYERKWWCHHFSVWSLGMGAGIYLAVDWLIAPPNPIQRHIYVQEWENGKVIRWEPPLALTEAAAGPAGAMRAKQLLLSLQQHSQPDYTVVLTHRTLSPAAKPSHDFIPSSFCSFYPTRPHGRNYLNICVQRRRSGSPGGTGRWSFPWCWSRFQRCRSPGTGSTRQCLAKEKYFAWTKDPWF